VLETGVLLFGVVFLLSSRYFARREGYYSTVVVFGFGCLLYYMAVPIEMTLAGAVRLDTDIGSLPFSADFQGSIVLLGAMAFAAFTAGYALSGFRPLGRLGANAPAWGANAGLSVLILTLGSVLGIAVAYREELVAVASYKGSYEVIYNSSGFAVLLKYATIGLAVVAAGLRQRRHGTWAALPIVVLLVGWGVYSSTKHPILLAALAMASPLAGLRSRRPWHLAAFLLLTLPLTMTGPILFSQYRGGIPLSLDRAVSKGLFFRQTDPVGPMVSLVDAVSGRQPWAGGETYLLTNITWVPRAVWPSRPLDLAEQYARERLPRWKAGMGLGYSLLAESYVNFGWLGPIAQYLALGFLWGMGWRLLRSWFVRVGEGYWRAMYTTMGFYQLVIMHRGPTSSITTFMMQMFVPLLVLSAFVDRRRANPRPAAPRLFPVPPPREGAPAMAGHDGAAVLAD
jgi:hypothetical protein